VWKFLDGTVAEVEAIEKAWQGDARPLVLEGRDASEAALRRAMPGCRYIHLATHGFFADEKFRSMAGHDEAGEQLFGGTDGLVTARRARVTLRNPLILSGIVLAGANMPSRTDDSGLPTGQDGLLTAEEIAAMDLRGTQLVVLSACETGLGRVAGGEGVMGLGRAFHLAGARNVVASLWKVDDQATAALMRLFYHKLWKEEKPPIVALREAQLAICHHPRQIAPLATSRGPNFAKTVQLVGVKNRSPQAPTTPAKLWAGFVLSGAGQ
jgi:CHAT domain-containing protein